MHKITKISIKINCEDLITIFLVIKKIVRQLLFIFLTNLNPLLKILCTGLHSAALCHMHGAFNVSFSLIMHHYLLSAVQAYP